MMGVLADAVLAAGGTVLGVIPDFLTKWEVAHPGVTEMADRRQHARPQAPHGRGSRCLRHAARRHRHDG